MKSYKAYAVVEKGKKPIYPDFPITGVDLKRANLMACAIFMKRKDAVTAKKESDARMKSMGMKPLSVKVVPCKISI